ncbi:MULTISPECIES: hypothetical protein [Bacillus]|uniref:hypothetical protein n=1 Tax=Bacillus TaxID=1386 RepID=UPI0004025135|nr:hypothetical protein [Bacillus sp. SB47]
MKKADFRKKISPLRGGILGFGFLVLKKPAIQPVFCDFGAAKIESFLILILYRNNKIFENGSQPLSVKGLGRF